MARLEEPEVILEDDRPVYKCPSCHEIAMQFFRADPDQVNREDAFVCRSCGRSWEV